MKKETVRKHVRRLNSFGNLSYDVVEVKHIECSMNEFIDMLNAKNSEIVAVKRNEFTEHFFKFEEGRYLIFNLEFGIEKGYYADSLLNENLVSSVITVRDSDIRDDLQDYRIKKGLTIQALADLLGTKKVTTEKWLLKERYPSARNRKKIEDIIYGELEK